jgi:hypothetical protein
MVADELPDYLYDRSTGHFASLMTLITRGCLRAMRSDVAHQPWVSWGVLADRRRLGHPRQVTNWACGQIPIRLPPLPGDALDSWIGARPTVPGQPL